MAQSTMKRQSNKSKKGGKIKKLDEVILLIANWIILKSIIIKIQGGTVK
jgi:hypothetical protein